MSKFELPESELRKLVQACEQAGITLNVFLDVVPHWLLLNRPEREMNFHNQFGVLDAELNALHEKLWDCGIKAKLSVKNYQMDFSKDATGKLTLTF